VECLIGLRVPDAGMMRVMGLDPRADRDALHATVGVQLQSSALPGQLRVGEIPRPVPLREVMIPILRDIGDWTPLGAAVRALQSSMQGAFPPAQLLLVMATYTLLFGFLGRVP
jgi:hypothetical protein